MLALRPGARGVNGEVLTPWGRTMMSRSPRRVAKCLPPLDLGRLEKRGRTAPLQARALSARDVRPEPVPTTAIPLSARAATRSPLPPPSPPQPAPMAPAAPPPALPSAPATPMAGTGLAPWSVSPSPSRTTRGAAAADAEAARAARRERAAKREQSKKDFVALLKEREDVVDRHAHWSDALRPTPGRACSIRPDYRHGRVGEGEEQEVGAISLS